MKTNAIVLPNSGDRRPAFKFVRFGGLYCFALLALATPATAQAGDDSPEKPVTDTTVTVGDVAATPLNDLNLSRDKIPDLLLRARTAPYDRQGIEKCSQIAAAVGELDAVLGDDLDIAEAKNRSLTPGRVAKWAVSSFIPFRGLLREVTGAAEHKRDFQDAIIAGMMRRSYLKGLGQQQGCRYPASPADEATLAQIRAQRESDAALQANEQTQGRRPDNRDGSPVLVSEPVIQSGE